jgi:hypothetical protein
MERVEWPIVKNATGMPFSDPRYSPTNRTSAICRAKETLPFIQRTFIGVSLTGPEFSAVWKENGRANVKGATGSNKNFWFRHVHERTNRQG